MVHFEFAVLDASGNNSVVECDLAKVEVAGSNPVSRSTFTRNASEGASPQRRSREGGLTTDSSSSAQATPPLNPAP
jgi:hypothetical protein